jgi:hypothetical protein
VKTAEERVGQADLRTTLALYARMPKEADRVAAGGWNKASVHRIDPEPDRSPIGPASNQLTSLFEVGRGGARWDRTTDLSIISAGQRAGQAIGIPCELPFRARASQQKTGRATSFGHALGTKWTASRSLTGTLAQTLPILAPAP